MFWIVAICYSSIAPQVEKESGAEEEEDIRDSKESLNNYQLSISYGLKKTFHFYLRSWQLHDWIH